MQMLPMPQSTLALSHLTLRMSCQPPSWPQVVPIDVAAEVVGRNLFVRCSKCWSRSRLMIRPEYTDCKSDYLREKQQLRSKLQSVPLKKGHYAPTNQHTPLNIETLLRLNNKQPN